MSSLALTVLTLTVGMFFILTGQFKVTSKFFPDIHEDMRHEFGRINKVFPFYKITGWRPYAKNYRMTVGIIEVICGVILILIPGRLKQLANIVLLVLMLGAVYTHYALHDKLDRMAPEIIICLLLVTRLIIYQQGKITSKFFPDIYEDMRHEFGRINKVFPFYKITGWRPYAKNYRMTVGIIEVICGVILILIPGRLKQLANIVLLVLMLGAVYTHYALHDKLDRMAPEIIICLLLVTRLIIYQQGKSSRNEKSTKLKDEVTNEEKDNQQESVDEESEDEKNSSNEKKND
ncbi:unnamed protein product [Rotaria sp. Silwood1]|nr:unnamed protein product [Rotaria sp. Silwood1]